MLGVDCPAQWLSVMLQIACWGTAEADTWPVKHSIGALTTEQDM